MDDQRADADDEQSARRCDAMRCAAGRLTSASETNGVQRVRPIHCCGEQRGDGLQPGHVLLPEAAHARAVEVEHRSQRLRTVCLRPEHGDHDLALRALVAGDVIGVRVHVRHELRLAREHRRAAHAVAGCDEDHRGLAVEGAEHQRGLRVLAPLPVRCLLLCVLDGSLYVEAAPVDGVLAVCGAQGVVQQRGSVGHTGRRVRARGQRAPHAG